jgi:putative heme-binding domain-containing protein
MCAVCHTLKGEGAKIGPDLTGYERDNLDFMLPAIVDPSLGIREEYTLFTVTTKEGQVLAGFIIENNPQFVTIRDATGAEKKIARGEIKSMVASTTSLMPEGLLDPLTTQQTLDLFAYLRAK